MNLVIIHGFRSYRDQTVIEPFSSKSNVIVGRNGSGKSNFFYAIQFVLSDEFNHLRPEQRQALLHEGTGQRTISAFVEIIFDNHDNRLPIEKEEVVLRRVIGAKKDQYFLDKKLATKTDVMNLLESAGLSRSNPYYIVKQGKINQMATSPDSQRLKLLKEIAGVRVYDERKEESTVLLRETEAKRSKIDEVLQQIHDRLKTLEEEKEELKQYQTWDKMRRALEYTIHDNDLNDTKRKLNDLAKKRENTHGKSQELQDQLQTATKNIKVVTKDIKDLKSRISTIKEERDVLMQEKQSLIKRKAKLELVSKDLQDELESDSSRRKSQQEELSQIKKQIVAKQAELEKLIPNYRETRRKEDEISARLEWLEQRRRELYAKQGRGTQFESKEQRDRWLHREIKSLEKAIADKHDQISRLQKEIETDNNKVSELDSQMSKLQHDIDQMKASMERQNNSLYELKQQRDTLQSERNALWRQEATMQQNITNTKEEISKKAQSLRSITGRTVLNGIDSVQKVIDHFREKGIHREVVDGYQGLLIENFSCDSKLFTAVEVTAGNRLFHHIVANDRIGTLILKEMNKHKMPGEVTFMPLNRLECTAPINIEDNDAMPMLSKLEFPELLQKAFVHVFGHTLICRNMEVAAQFASKHDCDCITMDGDQVSRRGALTGGFYDQRNSRLELQKSKTELQEKLEELERDYSQHQDRLTDVESQVTAVIHEMQKTETRNNKDKDRHEQFKSDWKLKKDLCQSIQRSFAPKERSLQSLQSSLEAMGASVQSYKKELGTELLSQLSSQDQCEVVDINAELKRLANESKAVVSERFKLESKKNTIENLLNDNLVRRKEEITADLQDISASEKTQRLEGAKQELQSFGIRFDENKEQLEEIDNQLDSLKKDLEGLQTTLEENKQLEKEANDTLGDDSKNLEKITNKQSVLLKKKEDCMKKIRDLGSLPSDSFDKYAKLSSKQLFKKLDQANSELKKYSHVNKKALDQFVNFTQQKEKLLQRMQELDRGYSAIQELMSVLDNKKYEAIQLTFKQVTKFFSEVFQKLVPGGKAQLVMRRGEIDQEQVENQESVPLVEQFTGVSIKVSFSGKAAETREMSQLSGGQKSLVALTLIFAIQKCDPAPFYLFDEIDQALDVQHREAVASMIGELSENAQFIITTFRPELIETADKFYGVVFRNKVSHVDTITREQAQDFVEDDQVHG